MKLHSASIALLGLPAALAAVAATRRENATPTRPDPALGIPRPSQEPATYGINNVEESSWQEDANTETNYQDERQDELLRVQQKRDAEPEAVAEAEARPTSHTTSTNEAHNKTTASSSSTTAAPAADATEIAVFTAGGGLFTITSILGHEAVDGKSLTAAGAGILIGGDVISEGTTGEVYVNGQKVTFQPYVSSSAPAQRPASSQAGGASSSAAQASSSSSQEAPQGAGKGANLGGAAPVQTAGAKIAAVVGAVVGAVLL